MTIQKEASERLEDAKAAQMKQTNLVERLQVYPINILMNMVKEVTLNSHSFMEKKYRHYPLILIGKSFKL